MGSHTSTYGSPYNRSDGFDERPGVCTLARVNFESWREAMTRRDFARSLSGVMGGLFVSARPQVRTLRFAIMETSRRGYPFGDGVLLGYMEALQTAKLFQGRTLELVTVQEHGIPTSAAGIATLFAQRGAQVIIAALDDEETHIAALECHAAGAMFINCGAKGNDLRRGLCTPLVFHVEASEAMYDAAARLAPRDSRITLWDGQLEKYGAAQLNDRFQAAEGAPMKPEDWAGWFAIKAVWESFLRTGNSGPVAVARHMSSESISFDGHKGAPLSFRTWDHQLRQPLYAVSERITDVPDIGRASGSIREILDTLGDRAGVQSCRPA
jgi:hypothetical protein